MIEHHLEYSLPKKPRANRVFAVDFHQLRSRSCPRLYTTQILSDDWALRGSKNLKICNYTRTNVHEDGNQIEVEFRQALLNLGPDFVSNISHSNRSLENSSPLWVLQSLDPQVAGGAPVTWEHLGFQQPGTCHWKPNYHDQPRYITVVKYCDSEPLILISLRWNFMFGVTVSNATFTEPLKQAKVTVPLEERWQTAQLHALADSAPPGWEVSQAPDAQKTHSWWQWAMQQNITYSG